MKNAKHVAVSMNHEQEERLKSLSKDLEMPASRIVNHLIALTCNNQILKDLILKIDAFPGNCTSPETMKKLSYVQSVYDEAYTKMVDEINEAITILNNSRILKTWSKENIEAAIRIAKVKWLEEQ